MAYHCFCFFVTRAFHAHVVVAPNRALLVGFITPGPKQLRSLMCIKATKFDEFVTALCQRLA